MGGEDWETRGSEAEGELVAEANLDQFSNRKEGRSRIMQGKNTRKIDLRCPHRPPHPLPSSSSNEGRRISLAGAADV